MAKWAIHRIDANSGIVVDALIAAGATVEPLGRPVDLLVGVDGVAGVVEVKTEKGKLRDSQVKFFARFTGAKAVIRTPEEAISFVRSLKRIAREGISWKA